MHKRTDEQDVGVSTETAHLQETNHHTAKKEFKERSSNLFPRKKNVFTVLCCARISSGEVLNQNLKF